jgi:hypothetical protein
VQVDREVLRARLTAARAELEVSATRLAESRAHLSATRERWATSRDRRSVLHESAYARLLARFESQPVIEQAKGILMAESHCTPDEAFDLLRRVSQRQNIKVRDLAADIVDRAISGRTWRTNRPAPGLTRSEVGARARQPPEVTVRSD